MSRNFTPIALAQFETQSQDQTQAEAQGQAQGQLEAQGQLQGQAELQGQAQGQAELQAQGQGQGQGQEQYASNEANNYAGNSVESYSGNANLNGNANGNLNGNANLNYSENGVENDVDNAINNTVNTNVNTNVNVSVSGEFDPPAETSVLHMDQLDIEYLDGSFLVMPDFSTQTLTGDGNIFNLDQVNSMVDADVLNGASVSLNIGLGSSDSQWARSNDTPGDPSGPSFSFSQSANATGGSATNTSGVGQDGTATGAADGATSLTQEAFTQHIVMGANIQYNTMPISVVGGDSITDGAAAAE
jgi:hypothetical protein